MKGKPVKTKTSHKNGRRIRLWNAAKLVFGIVLVLGTAGATARGAYHLALSSSRFALTELQVQGGQRMGEQEVSRISGVELGQNLLALDITTAERRLAADPWIKSVTLHRLLPNKLRAELVEREAIALSEIGGKLFLVDALGNAFKLWQPGEPYKMPVLTGVSTAAWAADRVGARERLQEGLGVLEQYGRLAASKEYPAQEVHLADSGAVTLTVGKTGLALELGMAPWSQKMLMVGNVLQTFERERQLPGVVFLDNSLNPGRVVVRMR